MLYTLMHRDVPVMDLELDEYSNIVSLGKIHHAEHLPLGTYNKIGVERKALNRWWTKRSIPASRKGIRDVLEELELSSPQELIEKCFGLSLSDQYWISPTDKPLDWHRVRTSAISCSAKAQAPIAQALYPPTTRQTETSKRNGRSSTVSGCFLRTPVRPIARKPTTRCLRPRLPIGSASRMYRIH